MQLFIHDIGRISRDNTHIVAHLWVILWLYAALFAHFSPTWAQPAPVAAAQTVGAADGVGGSGFLEMNAYAGTDADASAAEVMALEAGVGEPGSFSRPQALLYDSYTIKKGDIIGDLAMNFGLNEDTLISINGIKNTRLLQIGQVLRVPNQDGIFYTVKNGDTLERVAQKYKAQTDAIQAVNELFDEEARVGTALFIPGARLDWMERQEINGDMFIWPASGRISSTYGYRRWPFGGNARQFHSGLDIAAPPGDPVRAAMSGRVSSIGWDDVLGNYVVVSHHAGYRTMYGHLSAVRTKVGSYVGTGERIGDVGSTGYSTGPHLHFTVYKNGVTTNPRPLLK